MQGLNYEMAAPDATIYFVCLGLVVVAAFFAAFFKGFGLPETDAFIML